MSIRPISRVLFVAKGNLGHWGNVCCISIDFLHGGVKCRLLKNMRINKAELPMREKSSAIWIGNPRFANSIAWCTWPNAFAIHRFSLFVRLINSKIPYNFPIKNIQQKLTIESAIILWILTIDVRRYGWVLWWCWLLHRNHLFSNNTALRARKWQIQTIDRQLKCGPQKITQKKSENW